MRIQDFCQHVNKDLLPLLSLPPGFPTKISLETARKILLDLCFERTDSGKKGFMLIGMKDQMWFKKWLFFVQKLRDLETHHLPLPCPSPLDSPPPPVGNFVSLKKPSYLLSLGQTEKILRFGPTVFLEPVKFFYSGFFYSSLQ